MIVSVIQKGCRDFYSRTKEDNIIISALCLRRIKELGESGYPDKDKVKAWARAFNQIHNDFCHVLPWLSELERHGSCSIRTS